MSLLRFSLPHVFLMMLASASALAETVYVNDEVFVPVRSGPGIEYRIVHKGIRSGTELEVISRNNEKEYTQVRTSGGLEGYIPNQYLSREPVAQQKLEKAEKVLATTREENKKLNDTLKDIEARFKALSSNHNSQEKQLFESQKELADIKSISANALTLDRRNRELHEANEQLRSELELANAEIMRLKDKSESNMMLIGGGLVLLGVFIALLVPMLKRSKKNDSWA